MRSYKHYLPGFILSTSAAAGAYIGSESVLSRLLSMLGYTFYTGWYRIRPEVSLLVPMILLPAFAIPLAIVVFLRISNSNAEKPRIPLKREGIATVIKASGKDLQSYLAFAIVYVSISQSGFLKFGARAAIFTDFYRNPTFLFFGYYSILCLPHLCFGLVAPRHGLFSAGLAILTYIQFERHEWLGMDTSNLMLIAVGASVLYVSGNRLLRRVLAALALLPLIMLTFVDDFVYLPFLGYCLLSTVCCISPVLWILTRIYRTRIKGSHALNDMANIRVG